MVSRREIPASCVKRIGPRRIYLKEAALSAWLAEGDRPAPVTRRDDSVAAECARLGIDPADLLVQ